MVVVSAEYPADLPTDVKMMKKKPKTKKAQQPHSCGQRRRRGVLLSLLPSFLLTPPLHNSSPSESQPGKQSHVESPWTQNVDSPAAPEPDVQPEQQGRRASLEPEPAEEIVGDVREESRTPGGEDVTTGSCTLSPSASFAESPVSVPTEGQHRAAVKRLLFGAGAAEERAAAAAEVGRIALAGGHQARKSLASLGVIPCLVDMLGCSGTAPAAARALAQLADGTYSNKVAMVEAGVIPKLTRALEEQDDRDRTVDDALMALLRAITSLARTSQLTHHLPPSSFTALLPALLRAINTTTDTPTCITTTTSITTKHAALSALLNLSSHLPNARPIVSSGFIPPLLRICSVDSEQDNHESRNLLPAALAVLGNLAMTPEGTAAVEREEEEELAPAACLVRVLRSSTTSEGERECQDPALRVLAALARRSRSQRRRMAEVGVVEVLVEVSLLSESGAARRRAAEMINWFKGPHCCTWAPHKPVQERYRSSSYADSGRSSSNGGCNSDHRDASAADEDVAVVSTSGKQRSAAAAAATRGQYRDEIRRMVRQSLDRNMESIVRRANAHATAAATSRSSSCLAHFSRQHLSPLLNEDIKDSVGSSSSKSLPF